MGSCYCHVLVGILLFNASWSLVGSFFVQSRVRLVKKAAACGLLRRPYYYFALGMLPEDRTVWIYGGEENDDQQQERNIIHWLLTDKKKSDDGPVTTLLTPLDETWRWCQDFVVPLNLCPWASASVTTATAMQFFVVPCGVSPKELVEITESVAQRFVEFIKNSNDEMAKVAIFFLVLTDATNNSKNWYNDFFSFYDWFVQTEDDWIDQWIEREGEDDNMYNLVTLAAFHPGWEFGGYQDWNRDALDYEKKSPHPTLTLVWTDAIDTAGPEATKRIAQHNAEILGEEMTRAQVAALYNRDVWLKGDKDDEIDAS